MKRKLFLLLPLLTAIIFGLIYHSIYKHFNNVYKDELIFSFLVDFSIFAEIVAFLGSVFMVFGKHENATKKENTIATIVFIAFTLQPALVFAGIVICGTIYISRKAILDYFKNPLNEN